MPTPLRIEIINTGTELLLGSTINTHASWIGRELFSLGMRVQCQTTVPDGNAIHEALKAALLRSDIVIMTGGLGPTSDDLSREITADLLELELHQDEAALRSLEQFFKIRNRPLLESNLKQAMVPIGADVLPNPNGTAPGLYIAKRLNSLSHCGIFLLPGPPREMHPMFINEVLPILKALIQQDNDFTSLTLKFTGIGESEFQQQLDAHLQNIPNLELGYCAHINELDIRLIGSSTAVKQGQQLILRHYQDCFINDHQASLAETVVQTLRSKNMTLALAESCTGGLISSKITDVDGASHVFLQSFITYSDASKINTLHVAAKSIESYGAVSSEVATEMALGALQASTADFAISVTGIAGPSGGSELKPTGTAWLSLASKSLGTIRTWKVFHPRNRIDFKLSVCQDALFELLKYLRK